MFEDKMAEFQAELNQTASTARKSPTIAALNTDFINCKVFVCNGLSVLRSEIDALRNNVDRIETQLRSKILLLHGVIEQPGVITCSRVVSVLATKCKVPSLTTNSITASYRMGKASKASTKPWPIVL
ncbi:unnamed protein product [Diatraea saccharalis]|uniref:Uncharacterized protein n=1 Tax=Diatraea saccharalis TaxID=40085 RepID=A0A9N9WDU1_9NEOP|nr:unnamed protein product [Diatraea saccharalis]